jgi:hypothetical protein
MAAKWKLLNMIIGIRLHLLGCGSFEGDNDGGHVITANAISRVLGQQSIQQFLHRYLLVGFILEEFPDDIEESLAILYISLPHPIAAHHNELVSVLSFDFPDVWLAGDHLLGVWQGPVTFIIEIAKRPSEVEAAIDAPHHNRATGAIDPLLFLLAFGFMVEREDYIFAVPAEGTSRVASIGNYIFLRGDQHHIGSAAGSVPYGSRVHSLVVAAHFHPDLPEFFGSLIAVD